MPVICNSLIEERILALSSQCKFYNTDFRTARMYFLTNCLLVDGWQHIYSRDKYTYKIPSLVWPIFIFFIKFLMHYSIVLFHKFQGSIKKEVKFPGVLKKNWCRISMGPGFWPWNFQEVSHSQILRVKSLKFPGGFQKSIHSTSSLAFSWNSPI